MMDSLKALGYEILRALTFIMRCQRMIACFFSWCKFHCQFWAFLSELEYLISLWRIGLSTDWIQLASNPNLEWSWCQCSWAAIQHDTGPFQGELIKPTFKVCSLSASSNSRHCVNSITRQGMCTKSNDLLAGTLNEVLIQPEDLSKDPQFACM
jgi:hypothetical protein